MAISRPNDDLRFMLKEHGVTLWQAAEKMGTKDYLLSRKMRHELDADTREKLIEAIQLVESENQS